MTPDRILYIEDNPQNMRLVRKILIHAGYQMLEAEDGLTGLRVAADEMPDLILLDINLPDIDGFEVANRLKASNVLSLIPVIALTANAMVGDRERSLEAGCDGYLPKPVGRQDLLSTVEEFLALRKLMTA
jgi:two-component system cell cycle response regulator DivK